MSRTKLFTRDRTVWDYGKTHRIDEETDKPDYILQVLYGSRPKIEFTGGNNLTPSDYRASYQVTSPDITKQKCVDDIEIYF